MAKFTARNLSKDRFGFYIYRLPSGFVRRYSKNKKGSITQIKKNLKERKKR